MQNSVDRNAQTAALDSQQPPGDRSQVSAPTLSLPKGGGAIRAMGDKTAAHPVTGTGSTTAHNRGTSPNLSLGPGESATIALAQELGADWVLIDERKGSREAEGRGLRVAGMLGVIEEARARDLVDYARTRDRLANETNLYVTDDVLRGSERCYQQQKLAREQAAKNQEPSHEQG